MKTLTGIIGMLLVVVFTGGITPVLAEEPLLIVTDPWPPYSLEENQAVTGMDVEIVNAVFQQLGKPVRVQVYPWKRCLQMVVDQEADMILDASIEPERKEFLYFPEEPVSEGITVFFIKKGRSFPFTKLADLNEFTAGAMLGYSYCEEIDRMPFAVKAERVATLEQNFKKLLAEHIDFLIEVDAVGYFTAKQMGVIDQIDILPNAAYCQGGNYLAFAKKPGYEQFAAQFGQALKAFKATAAYTTILANYGITVK